MRDQPYEKILTGRPHLSDLRGRQRRHALVLSAAEHRKPLGDKLAELEVSLGDPIGSLGVLIEYMTGRISRGYGPSGSRWRTGSSRSSQVGLRPGGPAALRHRGAAAQPPG